MTRTRGGPTHANDYWATRQHRRYPAITIPSVAERLLGRLEPDGECLVYVGSRNRAGYGLITWDGIVYSAHRIAYEIEYGPILDGSLVLHHCDNPPCCRPDHLFRGTDQDNMRDMKVKGRSPDRYGERNPRHKSRRAVIA
jgi:hypothetical protein